MEAQLEAYHAEYRSLLEQLLLLPTATTTTPWTTTTTTTTTNASQRSSNTEDAQNDDEKSRRLLVRECRQVLQLLNVEARALSDADADKKDEWMQRISFYRQQLDDVQQRRAGHDERNNDNNDDGDDRNHQHSRRELLLGSAAAASSSTLSSTHNNNKIASSRRLLQENESRVAAQNETLQRAQRVAAEMEDMALETMQELGQQRAKMQSTSNSINQVKSMTQQADGLLHSMSRKPWQVGFWR